MLRNNNHKSTKKLSDKIIKANKLRNIFAVLAIALTTLLITTTVTGGIVFFTANEKYEIISQYGVDSDAILSVDENQLSNLNDIDSIKNIGSTKLASLDSIKNEELLNERVSLEVAKDKDTYEMMSIIPTQGNYPKEKDEVLVPTWVLDVLDIEREIGKKINLDLVVGGQEKSVEFTLAGYYESLVPRGSGQTKIFTSQEFIDTYNKEINKQEGIITAFVQLKDLSKSSTSDEIESEIDKIANALDIKEYRIHPKYDKENISVSSNVMSQVIAIGVGVLLVILTGYLIIYNIFYISVSKDIKFYGLLKTIGTTSKQLKAIILKQAMKLALIGIPIGLVFGYIVSKQIIPVVLGITTFGSIVEVKFNLGIFIIATLFSIVTVLISCSKPGKVAGKVSPIEAVKYVASDSKSSKKTTKKGTDGAKPHKMALGNILKNRKRVFISVLSISLSALIVIFTISATLGLDPQAHADNQVSADISVSNEISYFTSQDGYKPISKDFIEKIESLEMVKEVRKNYSAITPSEDGMIYGFGVDIVLKDLIEEEIRSYGDSTQEYLGFNTVEDGVINAKVSALKGNRIDKELENLEVIEGNIDKEKFKTGNYILYYSVKGSTNYIKPGEKMELTFRVRDEEGREELVTEEFEVMAVIGSDSKVATHNLGMINLEEQRFMEIFTQYEDFISSIDIKLNEDVDAKAADKAVSKIILEENNDLLNMLSKEYYMDGILQIKGILVSVGAIIASILGCIGAINVINTMFTGILARKVEFAMLESIGMTRKQIVKMVLFEGIYYLILTIMVVVPLGMLVSYLAPMVLPIYGGFNLQLALISILVSLVIIAILMIITPVLGYKAVCKDSLIDRLRVNN